MSFMSNDDSDEVLHEINMTPLVDVMLVLLVVFMVTMPIMQHTVNVQLPRAQAQPASATNQTLRLSVLADGSYQLGDERIATAQLLQTALEKLAATRGSEAELHIQGERTVAYERVAQAMAAAQRAGVQKMGFVVEPRADHGS